MFLVQKVRSLHQRSGMKFERVYFKFTSYVYQVLSAAALCLGLLLTALTAVIWEK